MKVKEKKFYIYVEKWLKKYHLCFKTAKNKGLQHSRIDVIGIKDVGGSLSGEVEVIAVEVKKSKKAFAKACGQAYGYRVYANRIYLAIITNKNFTPDEISIASHLGIGLISINKEKCKEVLSSPYYKPITKLNLLLLENLALGKCQFCSSFFETGDIEKGGYNALTRENIEKAINDEKGLIFWNRELADRKYEMKIEKYEKDGYTHERRFICPDCVYYFFSQFKDRK